MTGEETGGVRARAWPVARFHSQTVPSLYAPASSLPSGLNATEFAVTGEETGGVRARAWPVARFHSQTVPSLYGLPAAGRPG